MKKYDVVGIGSALLDITFNVPDSQLNDFSLKKGSMQLIEEDQSKKILEKLNLTFKPQISPGGSAANTLSGISSLGGKAILLGKIGNDIYGKEYESLTTAEGVDCSLSRYPQASTGHAITFITPDFERTFATHLGAALYFSKEDVVSDIIKSAKILHLEAFQLEGNTRESIIYAVSIAKSNGLKISLDLSDASLVQRNLDFLKNFVKESVDIVFANEHEAKAFTGKEPELALNDIAELTDIAIVKLGEKGSLIRSKDNTLIITPVKVNVVNTNGAGDMYAAGVLFGIAKDLDLMHSGKIASYASSLVVSKPEARLSKKISKKLLENLK